MAFEKAHEKSKTRVSPDNSVRKSAEEGIQYDIGTVEDGASGSVETPVEQGENGQTETQQTETGNVKYSLKVFEDGRRFVDVQTDQNQFDGLSSKEKTSLAIQIIKQRFAGKVVGADNPIFVNGRSAAEYGHPTKNIDEDIRNAKMRVSTELDNLFDAGTNHRTAPDGADGHVHPNATGDFEYYDAIFKVGNEYYEGVVNVENVAKGRLLKDVTQIKNITQDISSSYGQNPKSTFLRDTSMDTISQNDTGVNTSIRENVENIQPKPIEEAIEEIAKAPSEAVKNPETAAAILQEENLPAVLEYASETFGEQGAEAAEALVKNAKKTAAQAEQNAIAETVGAVLGENGAKAFADSYKAESGGLSAAEAFTGFQAVYHAARNGGTMTEAQTQEAAALPESMRTAAVQAAQADTARAESAVRYGEESGIVRDENFKKAHLSGKTVRALDAVAKAFGIKVQFVEKLFAADGSEANAQYSDGVIKISLASKDPVRTAFTHEVVHRIRKTSPEVYEAMASFVVANMELFPLIRKSYRTTYNLTDPSALTEEIVADAFGTVLRNSDIMSRFVQDNRKPAQKLLDGIRDAINAIVRTFKGQNIRASELDKSIFSELEKDLRKMERLLSNAIEQAGAEQSTQPSGRKNGEVKNSIAEKDGFRYVQADRQVLTGNDPKQWEKQIENYINESIRQGKDVLFPTEDGHVLALTERSAYKLSDRHKSRIAKEARELLSDEEYGLKGRIATHIDELIQVGTFKKYQQDIGGTHENDIGEDGFNYFEAFFQDGDKKKTHYRVRFSSALNENNETVYSIGEIRKRNPPSRGGPSGETGAQNEMQRISNNIIYTTEGKSQEKSAIKLAFESAFSFVFFAERYLWMSAAFFCFNLKSKCIIYTKSH